MPHKPLTLLAFDPKAHADSFSAEHTARLRDLVTLLAPNPLASFEDTAARVLLSQTEILITGWGAPHLGAAELAASPHLRLVAHLAGSVKPFLDSAIGARDIAVTSAADANAQPVAEYTLAAILFANKKVFTLRKAYREARHASAWAELAPGLGNYRKTIGIVGASRVGRRVIALLKPFDFEVLLFDPLVDAAEALQLGARLVELDTLMKTADVVSIHAPLLPESTGMIDRRRLALMRSGATLINTARGAIVDQDALIEQTSSGRIDAIIDVTEPDILPAGSPLFDLPNVFLTPHIAGSLGTETRRMTDMILDEIERYIQGKPLQHRVALSELEHQA